MEQLLREKTESYDDLESAKLRLDSEVESNRTMIIELREIIRHLETDLEARCKTSRQQQQVVIQSLVCGLLLFTRAVVNFRKINWLIKLSKAFDRINWVKLMAILADIGVDWRDRNLIKELYINQKAFVMVGETISEACGIGRGVRQGCSLSPLLLLFMMRLCSQKSTKNV